MLRIDPDVRPPAERRSAPGVRDHVRAGAQHATFAGHARARRHRRRRCRGRSARHARRADHLKYTQSNSVCLVLDGQAIGNRRRASRSRIHCTRIAVRQGRSRGTCASIPSVAGAAVPAEADRVERDNAIDGYVRDDLTASEEVEFGGRVSPNAPKRLTACRTARVARRACAASRWARTRSSRSATTSTAPHASGVAYVVQPGGARRAKTTSIAACDELRHDHGDARACASFITDDRRAHADQRRRLDARLHRRHPTSALKDRHLRDAALRVGAELRLGRHLRVSLAGVGPDLQGIINACWFVFDIGARCTRSCASVDAYWSTSLPPWTFYAWGALALVTAVLLQLAFLGQFGEQLASRYSAFSAEPAHVGLLRRMFACCQGSRW